MRFVVDSDVFLHALLHTDRGEEARDFIDKYTKEIATTTLNVMEIGSVLSRKVEKYENIRRKRVGKYRILYSVDKERKEVSILFGHV